MAIDVRSWPGSLLALAEDADGVPADPWVLVVLQVFL